MTKNQIEYLKLLETQRSNQAVEAETGRANRERERQGQISLDEQSRSNLANEKIKADTLIEQSRHNLATESETNRANLARELETSLHNRNTEHVAMLNYSETARANRERERLTSEAQDEQRRANLAREAENERSHRADERIRTRQVTETERANKAFEDYRDRNLQATIDYNTGSLDLRGRELEESTRSHKAQEAIGIARNVTEAGYLAERVRSDLANEAENALHHRAMELKSYDTKVYNTNTLPSSSQTQSLPPKREPVVIATDERELKSTGSGGFGNGRGGGFGTSTYIVTNRYSDGSTKQFKEVRRNGKVVSREELK